MLEVILVDICIINVLGWFELIIDNENDWFGVDFQFDIKVLNVQKSCCLYELIMLFCDMKFEFVFLFFVMQM